MADKKITELQLISSVTDGVNMPGDDGIQTYRLTAAQLKTYVIGGRIDAIEAANWVTASRIIAKGVPQSKLADDTRIRFARRDLTSTLGSNSTNISDLRFENLPTGQIAQVFMNGHLVGNGGTATFRCIHDGSEKGRQRVSENTSASGSVAMHNTLVTEPFILANDTITFNTDDFGAGDQLIGGSDGDPNNTRVVVFIYPPNAIIEDDDLIVAP